MLLGWIVDETRRQQGAKLKSCDQVRQFPSDHQFVQEVSDSDGPSLHDALGKPLYSLLKHYTGNLWFLFMDQPPFYRKWSLCPTSILHKFSHIWTNTLYDQVTARRLQSVESNCSACFQKLQPPWSREIIIAHMCMTGSSWTQILLACIDRCHTGLADLWPINTCAAAGCFSNCAVCVNITWRGCNSIPATFGSAQRYSHYHWLFVLTVKSWMEWVKSTLTAMSYISI